MLKKSTAALLFLAAIIQSIFCAEWMDFGNGGKANQEPLQVFSGTNGVHADFYGVKYFQTTADDGLTYDRLEFTGKNGLSMAIGFPQVPLSTFYIEVSSDNPSVIVTPGDYVIYENYNLYPSQKFGEDYVGAPEPEFEKNLEAYGTDKFYPEILAEIKKPLTMRGRKISTVAFYPVQYNPVTKQLKIYTSLDVTVPEAASGPNVKDSYAFDSILKSFVINYESPAVPNPQANMLIITPDEFYEDLLPFKEWKEKLGIKTKIATRSYLSDLGFRWEADNYPNSTYDHIDGYIKSEYDGPNPPDYLLIIGDTGNDPDPHVPVHYVTKSTDYIYLVGTDFYYSTMDLKENPDEFGLYDFPDIMCGRISVDNNEQLRIVLDKIMKFEDSPYTETIDWYNKVLLASYFQDYHEDQEFGNFSDGFEDRFFVYTSEIISTMVGGYNLNKVYCDNYTPNPISVKPSFYYNGDPIDPFLDFNGNTEDIINAVNEGVIIINHRDHGGSNNYFSEISKGNEKGVEGWGDPYFATGHLDQLVNNSKLPVMLSINCMTGWFDGETDYNPLRNRECLGELFIRKENGGGVGFFGATRISASGYNDVLSIGMNHSIFNSEDNTNRSLGNILNYGKMWMYNYYIVPQGEGWFNPSEYYSEWNLMTFEIFHLFGDPAMEIRTAVPQKIVMRVDYDNNRVRVLNSYGQAVPYAKVTANDGINYQVGISNSEGYVNFQTDINFTTCVSAVVHNSIPAYTHHVKANEIWTAKDIRGNVIVEKGATLRIEGDITLPREEHIIVLGTLELNNLANLTMMNNSGIIVEADGVVTAGTGTNIIAYSGSDILVKKDGMLIANGGTFSYAGASGGTWNGIYCEVGSTIDIENTEISGAYTGISGAPDHCKITNSSFLNCVNGISLVNCPDYTVSGNRLIGAGLNDYGYAQGAGITLTRCSLPISGNAVQNFAEGIKLVSSSITLVKNNLTNNFYSGLLITGHGSKPVLVNTLSKSLSPSEKGLNNDIYGNNINYPFYNGAQIYMRYSAGAYLTCGYNNIHSDQIGVVPSVPCIRGVITTQEPVISKVLIGAEENYWGYDKIDEVNQPDFFFFRHSTFDTGYSINYIRYAEARYTEDGPVPGLIGSNEPRSTETTMLLNAMKLEDTGSSKASIRLYENIIKKYPGTPEYYVAESRLPGLYIDHEMPIETLLSSFDESIENETALGKKFFKGLRVSTHIKAKNYETAIMYAEEMKNEAETNEEAMLSEIDIAVANMMKEAEGKGKSGNTSDLLDKLLGILNGRKKSESSPSDITESSLPSQHELYQNYPNPFNPVTQIKFALAKTADVKLSVYNISGQLVSQLASGVRPAGHHAVAFDGSRLNSGIYYYTLEADGKAMTKKMVLTK